MRERRRRVLVDQTVYIFDNKTTVEEVDGATPLVCTEEYAVA